jgi:hypothetical protein
VENIAGEQAQQTSASSCAHLYLLLRDSKVSSLHLQSPVQPSKKQYRNQGPRKRKFSAHALQHALCSELSNEKGDTYDE